MLTRQAARAHAKSLYEVNMAFNKYVISAEYQNYMRFIVPHINLYYDDQKKIKLCNEYIDIMILCSGNTLPYMDKSFMDCELDNDELNDFKQYYINKFETLDMKAALMFNQIIQTSNDKLEYDDEDNITIKNNQFSNVRLYGLMPILDNMDKYINNCYNNDLKDFIIKCNEYKKLCKKYNIEAV